MPLTSRRHYANAAPQLSLATAMTASSSQVVVATDFTGWPAAPFYASLDLGTASAEIVLVTSVSGPVATLDPAGRGCDGTTAVSHAAGATFDFTVIAKDLDEANAHSSSSAGVHGVTGNIVGDTDTQVLSGKTLASPTLTGTTVLGATTLNGDIDNSAGHKFTGNPALIGQAAASGNKPLSLRDHTGSEKASVDETGNFSGLSVAGILKPTVFANATARDAAITSPADGMVVYLSDSDTLYVYKASSSAWSAVGSGGGSSNAPKAITLDPTLAASSTSFGVSNQNAYFRILGSGSWNISSIGFIVVTSAGNVSVAAYADNGSDAPGVLLKASAVFPCPAAGFGASIALGSTVTVNGGGWLAISWSTSTAKFGSAATPVTTLPNWRMVTNNGGPGTFVSNPTSLGTPASSPVIALWGI